ncbi:MULTISPECIES: retropepsin-like aspartic protease [unclassified Pseudomonas]|uniref:retropepsin-like aspartic protease n=1 Tax=unclassified Pseudomonas TaxID=196821 RepID=UPI001CBEB073|nr:MULTISPECIES: retropepsin-like aspartic protease [unclassified Pseudomonas]
MTLIPEENLRDTTTQGAPIYFLRPDQTLALTPLDNALVPVVQISIRPAFLENKFEADPSKEAVNALALIDTGADYVYIDEDFAERNGFLSNADITVSGGTASSRQKVHPALFKLPDEVRHPTQAADFISAPLRKNGRKYDVILGMQLLSNGALIMDFGSNVFRFELNSKPNK